MSMEIGRGPTTASDLPVLRVSVDRGMVRYLRERMYDRYRGRGWAAEVTFADVPPLEGERPKTITGASVYRFPARGPAVGEEAAIQVQSLSRVFRFLFTPGVPQRLEYDGAIRLSRGDRFMILPADTGEAYYIEARVPPSDESALRAAPPMDYEDLRNRYRSVDRYDERVVGLALELTAGVSTQYEKVVALKEYIEGNCTYNLAASEISGEVDRVAAFLFDTREGYCDLFASSLAVLCRAVGIPARVATGYLVDGTSMEGEAYIIRDRHAHVWTEVYFDGIGWVSFDSTENAAFVPGAGVGAALQGDAQDNARRVLIAIASVVGVIMAAVLMVALVR
ncbi:MAG: hypothetical protein C4342_04260, partial [Armatimonadota bacterium]